MVLDHLAKRSEDKSFLQTTALADIQQGLTTGIAVSDPFLSVGALMD
jgi:hypothetical protein